MSLRAISDRVFPAPSSPTEFWARPRIETQTEFPEPTSKWSSFKKIFTSCLPQSHIGKQDASRPSRLEIPTSPLHLVEKAPTTQTSHSSPLERIRPFSQKEPPTREALIMSLARRIPTSPKISTIEIRRRSLFRKIKQVKRETPPQKDILNVFQVLDRTGMWLCLRGAKNERNRNTRYAGSTMAECDRNQINTAFGFRDRSLCPSGYISPFLTEGLIVAVRPSEISLFHDPTKKHLIPFIGTSQNSGYGDRKYVTIPQADTSPKKYPVISKSASISGPQFFNSFGDFRRYKDYQFRRNYTHKSPTSWHDIHRGGDEFIATIKQDMVMGIYFSKSANPYISIEDGIAHAKYIQKRWYEKNGIILNIFKYNIDHFELYQN